MAGCSVVVLMSLVLAAGVAAIIAIIGAATFFLVFGVLFLVLGFSVLKKEDDPQKYRILRIVLITIGFLFLFIVAVGLIAFVSALLLAGA